MRECVRALPVIVKEKLNKHSPNVTFIIFKQVISLDDGDPPLLFQQWTEKRIGGARKDMGQPSAAPNAVWRR